MAKEKVSLQMLAEKLSQDFEYSKTASEHFVRSFFSTLKEALQKDNIVKIKGFGTFKLVVVNARESVNINTGQRVSLSQYNKITFTPDKVLKDKVNRPFSQFATIALDDEEIKIVEQELDLEKLKEDKAQDTTSSDFVSASAGSSPLSEDNTLIPDGEGQQSTLITAVSTTDDNPLPDSSTDSTADISDTGNALAASDNTKTGSEGEENESASRNENPTVDTSRPRDDRSLTDDTSSVSTRKRRHWLFGFSIFLGVILIIGAYVLGYSHLINTPFLNHYSKMATPAVNLKSAGNKPSSLANMPAHHKKAVKPVAKDSVHHGQSIRQESDSIAKLRKESAKYEQIPDGKYLIAGTYTYRRIKPDFDIKRWCMQVYGRLDAIPYIVKYNHLPSADNIPVGTILKLPYLIDK